MEEKFRATGLANPVQPLHQPILSPSVSAKDTRTMGVTTFDKKRKRPDGTPKPRVSKKQVRKAAAAYHSSSEDEDEDEDEVEPITNHVVPAEVEEAISGAAESSGDEDIEDGIQLPGLNGITAAEEDDEDSAPEAGDESGALIETAVQSEDEEDLENDVEGDSFVDSDEEGSDLGLGTGSNAERKTRKRNDPTAFATSISKILGSKLTAAKRADPVLSRSKDASAAAKDFAESKLEAKARRKLRDDKRTRLDRGREKDVLGINLVDTTTAEVAEQEKRLKKTAQRGVIKLFNAVRSAQVKAEEAAKEVQTAGVIGVDKRQEKVNEMSKKGFLDLLVEGGGN